MCLKFSIIQISNRKNKIKKRGKNEGAKIQNNR